jgi:hypothetical protein
MNADKNRATMKLISCQDGANAPSLGRSTEKPAFIEDKIRVHPRSSAVLFCLDAAKACLKACLSRT